MRMVAGCKKEAETPMCRRKYAGIDRLQERILHIFCQWFSGTMLMRSLGGPVFEPRAPPASLYLVLTLVDFDVDLR